MTERTCVVCATQLTGRQLRYCSQTCKIRFETAQRVGDPEHRTRRRRYQQAWLERSGRLHPNEDPKKVCPQCGRSGVQYAWTHCSRSCAGLARRGEKRPGGKLTDALECGDWSQVAAVLLDRTQRDVGECRVWSGSTNSGYPIVDSRGRSYRVHRLMAQAANSGADLGHMPVHHKCGNRLCVNPDHLQVVTPHENTAEMLERNAYLSRIADLEEALASLAPSHPLLMQRDRQLRIIA